MPVFDSLARDEKEFPTKKDKKEEKFFHGIENAEKRIKEIFMYMKLINIIKDIS